MSYTIISICAQMGTLHHHTPPHTTPFKTQQNCRPSTSHNAALLPNALITVSENTNSKNTSLVLHSLSRLPTRTFSSPETLSCLTASHSSNFLLAGARSGRCYLWHVFTGRLLATWSAHVAAINALAFCDDDTAVLTAANDATARLFQLRDVLPTATSLPRPVLTLSGHTLPITSVAVGYAGVSARVVTVSADSTAKIWHLPTASCVATVALTAPALHVVFTQDEAAFFVSSADGYIVCAHLHSLPLGSLTAASSLTRIKPPAKNVFAKALALSPNNQHLIAAYTDGVVRTYDVASLQNISAYAKHNTTAPITAVLAYSSPPSPELPLFERVPERSLDPNIAETFTPLIDKSNGVRTGNVAWSVIAQTNKLVYANNPNSRLPTETHVNQDQKRQHNERLLQNENDSLLKQISSLQRRNEELEHAGSKLIQIVENEII